MSHKVFLFPQTLFYPPRLLKADPFVERYFILNLLETKTRLTSFFRDKIQKIHLLNLKRELDIPFLSKVKSELKNLGEFLKTPESLKIYKLHQELFEETFPIFKGRETSLNATEKAFLLLCLAEDIDYTLLEVSLSLNDFSKKWEEIFQEKILFKDLYFPEDTSLDISTFEESAKEKLWEIQKRIKALKILLPEIDFPEEKPDTLLISEEEIFEEWREDLKIAKINSLKDDILIVELNKPLNEKLSLSENSSFPEFKRVIIVR